MMDLIVIGLQLVHRNAMIECDGKYITQYTSVCVSVSVNVCVCVLTERKKRTESLSPNTHNTTQRHSPT